MGASEVGPFSRGALPADVLQPGVGTVDMSDHQLSATGQEGSKKRVEVRLVPKTVDGW